MDDQTKATLAAALVGGYVLGRTKKGKLALSLATYLAGKRLGLDPRQLATEGMRRLGEIPQVAELQDQLKGEFLEAGRKAVTAAATRGMGTLSDTLRDRTASLGKKEEAEPEEEYEEEQEEPEEEPEEEEEEEEEPEEEEEEEEEEPEPKRPQRRRSSRKPARPERGTASRRERAPSDRSSSEAAAKEPSRKKKSSATKPAAKKAAPAKKSAPKKQAPAKRAASSGRPTKRTSKRADRRR
ncbi:histone protein [Streptomyces sp. NBC_00154]|uniref:histone protein n=1 Tax=Streptomyces sp. NBC_00154 TaxID=2975670 RepID=UPI0022520867|nr:histone protein [Streptomyces sp. NBC_00154]MCX5317574.1 histone protein [Streptomyces sp. NBC_00154]